MTKEKTFANIKTLLWATDFSSESRTCLPYIRFFSTALNSKNHALYVLPQFSDWVYETAFAADEELLKTIESTRDQSVAKMNSTGKRSGIPFETCVIEGRNTNEEIIKYANENQVDMIFVGRRGISDIEEILVGSTTSRLIRNSNIPVMVVPKTRKAATIETILCPIDMSELSMSELEYAIFLCRQLKAKLFVVHVAEFFNYKVPMLKRDILIEKINNNINEVAEANQFKIEGIIHETGEPAKRILEVAKKNKIDLITMSTHQRKGIEKFFLGSISEKVLVAAHIPVLILPPLPVRA